LLSVATVPALSGMLVFVAFFLFSKVVAIASLGGILSSALITSYLSIHFGLTTSWVALMLTLIVFVRHRSNLERLLSGSEEPFASIRSE
ncbi:MAG: glycerol-3-phosphate acyltransferase, partial [Bdellovibrionales bacterium]|nr:glycerol-3-phosphate acyltransferase [Bdellovibrionales bacterium]